jgi:hypothetical protein
MSIPRRIGRRFNQAFAWRLFTPDWKADKWNTNQSLYNSSLICDGTILGGGRAVIKDFLELFLVII